LEERNPEPDDMTRWFRWSLVLARCPWLVPDLLQMASMVGPLMMIHANTPRPGTVEAGMGIHEGHALGDAAAAAFGRSVSIGAETARNVANMPLAQLPETALPRSGPGAPPNAGMYQGYPRTCSW
jgi:hypothetical protein